MDVNGASRSSSSSAAGRDCSESDHSGDAWSAFSGDDSISPGPSQQNQLSGHSTAGYGARKSDPTTAETLSQQTTDLDRARGGYPAPSVNSVSTSDAFGLSIGHGEWFAEESSVGSAVAGVIGGNNGIYSRSEISAREFSAIHNRQVLDSSSGKAAVVSAVVVDNVTGEYSTGINSKQPLALSDAHPVIKRRLENFDFSRSHRSHQGNHAEVHALNDALWQRERHKTKGIDRPVTEADLPSMTMQTAWTESSRSGQMMIGEVAHRCANCTQLTDGVHNLAGDSTVDYSRSKAQAHNLEVATDPPSRPYMNNDLSDARRGGLFGGVAALGMSGYQNFSDGISGDDFQRLATDTGLGATTGAVGEVIENSVSRFIHARSGPVLQNAGTSTRVVTSRVAGAGVAGAVISAGFSSVDQIQAWQRGEVTGSEAIGTVTAEAATGFAAGATGAAAGAAVGSIIPVAGTAVGGVVGFGVGMAAGWAADRGLRAAGVTDAIADGVTSAVDTVGDTMGSAADVVSGWGRSLSLTFGW